MFNAQSLVKSLSFICRIMNRKLKSATQQKLNRYSNAGNTTINLINKELSKSYCDPTLSSPFGGQGAGFNITGIPAYSSIVMLPF